MLCEVKQEIYTEAQSAYKKLMTSKFTRSSKKWERELRANVNILWIEFFQSSLQVGLKFRLRDGTFQTVN